MKKSLSVIVLFPLCAALSACDGAPVKTVDYYSEHMEEALHVIAVCQADAGHQVAENCRNARKARDEHHKRTSEMDTGVRVDWE